MRAARDEGSLLRRRDLLAIDGVAAAVAGGAHGLTASPKDRVNADLLAFLKS